MTVLSLAYGLSLCTPGKVYNCCLSLSVTHKWKASLERKLQWHVVFCHVLQVWASAAISLLAFVVKQRKITSRRCLCFGKFSITWASSLPTVWDRSALGWGRSYFCAGTDRIPDRCLVDCRQLARKESGSRAVLEKLQGSYHSFFFFLVSLFYIIRQLEMKVDQLWQYLSSLKYFKLCLDRLEF